MKARDALVVSTWLSLMACGALPDGLPIADGGEGGGGGGVGGGGVGGGAGGGTVAVSFRADIAPLLKAHCTGGCHGDEYKVAATALARLGSATAHNAACASQRRVVPGDASESLVMKKLSGTAGCGTRMPALRVGNSYVGCTGEQCMPGADVERLAGWILQGAQNN